MHRARTGKFDVSAACVCNARLPPACVCVCVRCVRAPASNRTAKRPAAARRRAPAGGGQTHGRTDGHAGRPSPSLALGSGRAPLPPPAEQQMPCVCPSVGAAGCAPLPVCPFVRQPGSRSPASQPTTATYFCAHTHTHTGGGGSEN